MKACAPWPRWPLSRLAESIDYGVTASARTDSVGPKFLRITDIQLGAVNWQFHIASAVKAMCILVL